MRNIFVKSLNLVVVASASSSAGISTDHMQSSSRFLANTNSTDDLHPFNQSASENTPASFGFVGTVLSRQCGEQFAVQLIGSFADPFTLIVTSSLVPVFVKGVPM